MSGRPCWAALAVVSGRAAGQPGSRAEMIKVFTIALLGMAGVLAVAAGIQTVLRLRVNESEGRAELLLTSSRTRGRWLGANTVLAAASAVAAALVAGTATAIGLSLSASGNCLPGLILGAALAHVPSTTMFSSSTAVVSGAASRIYVPAGWGILVVGLVLGKFWELLGLPMWLPDMSPFRHSAAMPVDSFDLAAAGMPGAFAVLGAGLAAAFIGRSDLTG
ncbi:hypothetical protein [Paeniglutamicibacter terrestris]|uniref:ABC transporter permease n=1 Tax=Paeniglutamicibacter terrestris TaxID=2723403 RepID=A0ABX1G3X7_9MICC|nr:hypothetical protein [Paeniglutamicibacter terrestris]NKG20935.1 hypothetical protein [Paeniglutamicibacter terrestris]